MSNVFVVVDAARLPANLQQLHCDQRFVSLYNEKVGVPSLRDVAPLIAELDGSDALLEGSIFEACLLAGGLLLGSGSHLGLIRAHLRKFLIVRLENTKRMYFRFYDPRILKDFLPTCTSAQLNHFFGPICAFAVRGDHEDAWLILRLLDGELQTSTVQGHCAVVSGLLSAGGKV